MLRSVLTSGVPSWKQGSVVTWSIRRLRRTCRNIESSFPRSPYSFTLANRKTGSVTLAALNKAFLWAMYLEAHARRIYSAVLCPDTAAARELAKHLQRAELPDRFTLRDTYRKGWAGLGTKEEAEAATEILCELDWIRPIVETGRTTGRPASPTFETNPNIRDSAPAN